MNQLGDGLRQQLVSADRLLQPEASAEDSVSVSIECLKRRGTRRAIQRLATSLVILAAGFAGATWFAAGLGNRDTALGIDRNRAELVSIAAIKRDATAAVKAAAALGREAKLDALRREYQRVHSSSRTRLVDLRSPAERAAQLGLALAAELDRQFHGSPTVMQEYRRIVDEFPDTSSAKAAKLWLAQAR